MTTIEPESLPILSPAPVIYSGDSRLHHLRSFLGAARRDLRGSWPTAKQFFLRNLAQTYRYSSLGILWAFVPFIITAIVLIAGQKTGLVRQKEVPAPFYGVFGLTLAMTFIEALNALRLTFTAHQVLLRRNNVPIEGLIAAGIVAVSINGLIRLVVLIVAFIFFGVTPAVTAPLALLGFVGTLLLGCGVGLLLAPFSSLRRDIDNMMGFLPWIIFAATPVFVKPGNKTPVEAFYGFNPLAWIFDSTRTLAYGVPGYSWPAILSVLLGLGILIAGWLLCRLWRPYVVERLLV